MQSGKQSFQSRILIGLAALAAFLLLLALGFWQLDRAAQKNELYASYLEKSALAPIDLNNLVRTAPVADMLWRKGIVHGQYLERRDFILDNQILNGQPGYFVFSPFSVDLGGSAIMVNRGWVPAGYYRDVIPEIVTTEGLVTLSGTIMLPPVSSVFSFDAPIEEKMAKGISRMQNIDLDVLADILGQPLLPYVLQLDPASPTGYARQWNMPGSGAEKHFGYAFQWFALAAALLIIFITIGIRQQHKHE
jgi:surfeit locus 1 family protein